MNLALQSNSNFEYDLSKISTLFEIWSSNIWSIGRWPALQRADELKCKDEQIMAGRRIIETRDEDFKNIFI